MKLLSHHPFFAPRIDGMGIDATNDIVFVDSIRVQAKIGHDCWDPMYISMYLLLKESYLDIAGKSDNLSDSIDYSDLAEKVRTFIKEKSESESPSFGSTDDLIQAVSERAFDLAKGAAAAVRVTIGAPKLMLPAGFSVDIITSTPTVIASKWVLIEDLILLVIIGVNSAERESKQQVIVNLLFEENSSPLSSPSSTVVNYQEVVAQLCEEIKSTSYQTLEAFVTHVLKKTSCMCLDRIDSVTAQAQKPSSSGGVQIRRQRYTFADKQ